MGSPGCVQGLQARQESLDAQHRTLGQQQAELEEGRRTVQVGVSALLRFPFFLQRDGQYCKEPGA